jgi:hypothetical protein
MKVALLCSSKSGMEATLFRRPEERWEEEEEPPSPPDLLAECDSDDTIEAVEGVLRERHQVFRIESDEKAYARLKRLKPHLVFNISERLFGPNRETRSPSASASTNRGPRRSFPTIGFRTRRSGSSIPPTASRRASGFRPSSSPSSKARARASGTTPSSAPPRSSPSASAKSSPFTGSR